jgi:hypothetical protein
VKGKMLALVLITTIVLSLSPMLHLTPINIAFAQNADSLPLCAMKGKADGYICIPTVMNASELKVEFWNQTNNLSGDIRGCTSPYANLENWPDHTVDMKDIRYISQKYGISETDAGWTIGCYLADCVPDHTIDIKDCRQASKNYGNLGTYGNPYYTTGLYVIFQPSGTNSSISDDNDNMCVIPTNDVNFTVYKDGSTISALITFWHPRVPQAYFEWLWHFAPYFYTFDRNLTADATQDNYTVCVENATWYEDDADQNSAIKIWDDLGSEWNIITQTNMVINTITLQNALAHNYTQANHAQIEAPDPNFGRRPYAAFSALNFLNDVAYCNHTADGRCPYQNQSAILDKITSLIGWLDSIQCKDTSKDWYGGWRSQPDLTDSYDYWSFDCARGIESCMDAYNVLYYSNSTASTMAHSIAYRCVVFLHKMHDIAADYYSDQYVGFIKCIRFVNTSPTRDYDCEINDGYAESSIARVFDTPWNIYDVWDKTWDFYWNGLDRETYNHTTATWEYAAGDGAYDVASPDALSFPLLGFRSLGEDVSTYYWRIRNLAAPTGYSSFNSTKCWPSAYNDTIDKPCNMSPVMGYGTPPYPEIDEPHSDGQPFYAPVTIGQLLPLMNEYDEAAKAITLWTIIHNQASFMFAGVSIESLSPLNPKLEAMECIAGIAQFFVDY